MKDQIVKLVMESYDKGVADAMKAATEAIDVAIKLEREACAKVCDQYDESWYVYRKGAAQCAASIRARGNAVCGFPVVIDESIPQNQFEIRARGERQ